MGTGQSYIIYINIIFEMEEEEQNERTKFDTTPTTTPRGKYNI